MSSDHDQMDLNDGDSSNNHQNQADKRAHHNALERKRRDHIKGSFSDLRDVIPLLKGEKASRAHILKSATDYIRTMKPKNQQRQKAIVDIKRQNALLELQVRLLERMKETGLYTQNHEQVIKNNGDLAANGIQTTRNLLNYSTI